MSAGPKKTRQSHAPGQDGTGRQQAGLHSHESLHLGTPGHEIPSSQENGCGHSFDWLLLTLREFVLVLDSKGAIQTLWTSNQESRRPSETALLGRRLEEFLEPGPFDQLPKMFQHAIETRQYQDTQYSIRIAGDLRWFLVRVAPVADAAGGPVALCLTSRDNTVRFRQFERLQKSEALLAQAEEIAGMGSWEHNLETGEIFWSDTLYRALGLDPEKTPMTENLFLQFVHPDDREMVRTTWHDQSARPYSFVHETRWVGPDGQIRIRATRGMPVINSAGRVVRVVGMSQDITERKAAEEKIAASERQLRQILDSLFGFVGLYTLDGVVMEVNRAPLEIAGLAREDVIGKLFWECYWWNYDPTVQAELQDAMARAAKGEIVRYEPRVRVKGGKLIDVDVIFSPLLGTDQTITGIVGFGVDVTEHRRAEAKLRRSEPLLAHAEEIANLGSWEYDLRTRKVTLSEQLLRMYGVASEAEWSEETYWERMHPEDREKSRAIADCALAECKPFEYVARYLHPDWKVRVHFIRGLPIPGADGKAERLIGIVQDITAHARAEEDLRRLSQQLLRTRDDDRRYVARELHESAGQSLAALKMTLGRLRDTLPDGDNPANDLLQSATELAEAAIREVRTVSYLMHPPLLDEAGLGSALRWYAEGFSKRSGIAVRVEVPDDFGRCSQEIETTVFRIMQEALTNVHRYSGSRTATIRLAREERRIVAEVRDEGCGLGPGSLAPDWHAPYGVGIAGMRERVKHLNGVFDLESTPGRGTTVRAILPIPSPELQASLAGQDGANDAEIPET